MVCEQCIEEIQAMQEESLTKRNNWLEKILINKLGLYTYEIRFKKRVDQAFSKDFKEE